MIDAVDSRFGKRFMDRRVEGLRGPEVAAERFFHDHTRLRDQIRPRQAGRDGTEQARRDRQVEQRTFGLTERLS